MELDELKETWQALEQRIEAREQLAFQLLRETRLDALRSSLGRVAWGQALQLAIWIAVAVVAARFWIERLAETHHLVAGLAIHVYAVAGIVFSVVQLALIARASYAAPVVALQRQLASLRRTRLLGQLVLGLPMWMLWIVGTMVGAELFLGIDLYAASPGWIHISLAVGAAGMALTVWVARRFAGTPRGARFLQRRFDEFAGRGLVRATRQLDEIARFSRE